MHDDWRECPLLINTLNGLAADLCNGMPARIGGKTLVTVSPPDGRQGLRN